MYYLFDIDQTIGSVDKECLRPNLNLKLAVTSPYGNAFDSKFYTINYTFLRVLFYSIVKLNGVIGFITASTIPKNAMLAYIESEFNITLADNTFYRNRLDFSGEHYNKNVFIEEFLKLLSERMAPLELYQKFWRRASTLVEKLPVSPEKLKLTYLED